MKIFIIKMLEGNVILIVYLGYWESSTWFVSTRLIVLRGVSVLGL